MSSVAPSAVATGKQLDAVGTDDTPAVCPVSAYTLSNASHKSLLYVPTQTAITARVTGPINSLPTGPAVTVTFGSSVPLLPVPTSPASNVGNFGSCTLPQIEFGTGFDNRKETSFQPVDQSKCFVVSMWRRHISAAVF